MYELMNFHNGKWHTVMEYKTNKYIQFNYSTIICCWLSVSYVVVNSFFCSFKEFLPAQMVEIGCWNKRTLPHKKRGMAETGSQPLNFKQFFLVILIYISANSWLIYGFRFGVTVVEEHNDWIVVWPGNSTSPVLGRPKCGWDGEYCERGKTIRQNVLGIKTYC